jgi:hypothetical protein
MELLKFHFYFLKELFMNFKVFEIKIVKVFESPVDCLKLYKVDYTVRNVNSFN